MYTVEYGYYNYPTKIRKFDSYETAKKFFHYIRKQTGVKKTKLEVL